MAIYNREKKFVESLGRALKIIESGLKVGADNLELILTDKEVRNLGPMVEILNQCEIEYKQGNPKKLQNIVRAIKDYKKGDKMQLRAIYAGHNFLRNVALRKDSTEYSYTRLGLLNTLESWSKAEYRL